MSDEELELSMCLFRYVSDISGYTEALYHPKTEEVLYIVYDTVI